MMCDLYDSDGVDMVDMDRDEAETTSLLTGTETGTGETAKVEDAHHGKHIQTDPQLESPAPAQAVAPAMMAKVENIATRCSSFGRRAMTYVSNAVRSVLGDTGRKIQVEQIPEATDFDKQFQTEDELRDFFGGDVQKMRGALFL